MVNLKTFFHLFLSILLGCPSLVGLLVVISSFPWESYLGFDNDIENIPNLMHLTN